MIFNHAHIAPWSRFLIFVSLTSAVTAAYAQTSVQEEPTRRSEPASVITYVRPVNEIARLFIPAVKANLLLWAVGAPNLGVEFRLGRRFSLAASGAFSHWHSKSRYALQENKGGVDVKYWFGKRVRGSEGEQWSGRSGRSGSSRPLTGWNCGVWGVMGGRFDVQWNQGWQGDRFWTTGITGGYSFPVHRALNIEVSASPGWFFSPEVRHYHNVDGALLWQQTRHNMGRFMFKCAVNLVWLPGGMR